MSTKGGVREPKIAVVGPCGAGKTTLARELQKHGYAARQIAQEHSYVPEMWQVLSQPDILIYLDAGYPIATSRKMLDWLPHEYEEELRRLEHARQHCDLYIDTDDLSATDVLEKAIDFLEVGHNRAA